MCRVLSYLGKPIIADELLYKPDNSLIKQSYAPNYMENLLNLAGFGFAAWDHHSANPEEPFLYRIQSLPFYDENLYSIAAKINANCLVAHVRGIVYSEKEVLSHQNVHPFKFDNSPLAFAHNGSLVGFQEMRYDLLSHVSNEYRTKIKGTTDSETMYALFLSQFPADQKNFTVSDVFGALTETFIILNKIRHKHHLTISSPLNFFISNGEFIAASRLVFDYGHYPSPIYSSAHMGYHSLWYTFGEQYGCYDGRYQMKASPKKESIIIASEPLTEDSTTWIEVPEYSFIGASLQDGKVTISSMDIVI